MVKYNTCNARPLCAIPSSVVGAECAHEARERDYCRLTATSDNIILANAYVRCVVKLAIFGRPATGCICSCCVLCCLRALDKARLSNYVGALPCIQLEIVELKIADAGRFCFASSIFYTICSGSFMACGALLLLRQSFITAPITNL